MVEFQPMTEDDFSHYLEEAVKSYSLEKQKGEGIPKDKADQLSQETFNTLLSEGLETKNHYLFMIREKGTQNKIGIFWFAVKEGWTQKYAYIYDFELQANFRGLGYGQSSLEHFEELIKKMDINSMALHVFGHNKNAIGLYEKFGFRPTNINMRKDLN